MIVGFKRAVGFARRWHVGTGGILEEELEIQRGDRRIPATLLRPRRHPGPLPVWVVLHGITRPGRQHPTLVRFVRALAGSGLAVFVPEVPEWRDLYLAQEEAVATIRASVTHLESMGGIRPGRIGVMGFSLGVPQVLLSAADPSLEGRLRAVAGFGGYGDLDRAMRFIFHGEHEWEGVSYRADPDPYGRWVVGGNYLTRIPGLQDAGDVAQALLELARRAGDLQVGAWEACYDAVKEELLEGIHPSRRELFRAFAPATGERPPEEASARFPHLLAQAARTTTPYSEPLSFVHGISIPVRLVHGRGDRLIPFSESLRLASSFPEKADVRVYLTGLFSHSQADKEPGAASVAGEQIHFLRILTDLLGLL